MPRIVWISLGLITGFFARIIAGKSSRHGLIDIALGIVGAIIGGWLFSYFAPLSASELSQNNILIDVIGAAALLVLYQAVTSSAP